MTIVIFWVQVLVNPRTVSANELLRRAVASQNPLASLVKTTRRRIAHQKMRIRSGKQTVIRDFEWKLGSPIEHVRWERFADPLAWSSPMTAQGFGDWRSSLLEKTDKVQRSGDRLTLQTKTTGKDPIQEAWIVVRAGDFHPVEQHLRFSDDQQLDFTELAFQIGDEPQPALQSVSQAVAPKPSQPAVPPPQVNLDETELQLRYILFEHQWDLGEDLVIGRTANQVTLSGTVSSKEREGAMRAILNTLPEVQLSVEVPSVSGTRTATPDRAIVTKDSAVSPALLKNVLEQAFPSRDERLAFVDRRLADADLSLSHAWALKRLVEKYNEAEEQRLKPESDAKLHEMLRAHLVDLSRANEGLQSLLELLPVSDPDSAVLPSNWRGRILALFNAVQQQDRLVARLVVSSQTDGQNLATASAEFRSVRQAINALLAGLQDLTGAPAPK
jgi:hypothetical protein